jgi:hypothetical protein
MSVFIQANPMPKQLPIGELFKRLVVTVVVTVFSLTLNFEDILDNYIVDIT